MLYHDTARDEKLRAEPKEHDENLERISRKLLEAQRGSKTKSTLGTIVVE